MFKSRVWYVVGAVCCVVAIRFVTVTNKQIRPRAITVDGRESVKQRQRPTYPYSVISGGVESRTELRTALLTDSVAAEHYAGFHVERTQVIRLNGQRRFFVSYRKGNQIYWTRNRLTIPKGETILTDGDLSARTRCGNRLSDTPQSPVLEKEEPSPKEFEEIPQPDSSPARWNGENWRETETSGTVDKDYQSSFGPDLGSLVHSNGGVGGGGGSGPSGGGSIQRGEPPPSAPVGSTIGGSNTGSINPIPGNPSAPLLPSIPPITPQPVFSQPPTGVPTGGSTANPLPAIPIWAPVSYTFPYVSPIYGQTLPISTAFIANSYPSFNVEQTMSPLGVGNTTKNEVNTDILPSGGFQLLSVATDNVPIAESPEPHTLALIMAAAMLACASGSVRQRLRKQSN